MSGMRNQWFCTTCKYKFESDRDRPNCIACGSGYVLCNNPVPPLNHAATPTDTGSVT
jgi:hypothetical protein